MHKDIRDIKSQNDYSLIKCNDYSLIKCYDYSSMFRKGTASTLTRLDLIDVQQFLRL